LVAGDRRVQEGLVARERASAAVATVATDGAMRLGGFTTPVPPSGAVSGQGDVRQSRRSVSWSLVETSPHARPAGVAIAEDRSSSSPLGRVRGDRTGGNDEGPRIVEATSLAGASDGSVRPVPASRRVA